MSGHAPGTAAILAAPVSSCERLYQSQGGIYRKGHTSGTAGILPAPVCASERPVRVRVPSWHDFSGPVGSVVALL
jgi:hypothetical protein